MKRTNIFTRNIKNIVTFVIILLIFGVSAIVRPELFEASRFPEVINSVLMWIPLILTVSMGMMMVVITTGIDLSVGSTVGLSAMVAGIMFRDLDIALWVGILVSMAVGLLCGAVNGAIIAYLNIPPIIVTLGTMNIYRGLTFIISNGTQVTNYELPEGISDAVTKGIYFGNLLIPWMVWIALSIVGIFALVLCHTHFGREIYAVGSNREAAHLRGINYKSIVFKIYAITGLLSGIAGMMYASRYGYVNPSNTGYGFEFVVISATIIGGVSVSGGSGTVSGTLLGCLLLGTVNTMLAMVGIGGTVQRFSYGVIIIIALVLDRIVQITVDNRRKRAKGGETQWKKA
jgi:rhamnose transport system permease protein